MMVEGISELDIRRLQKDRPELESELVEFFAAALERFVASRQYPVLKNVSLSYFFDEEALDSAGFADSTFEELVQIGVFDVCSLQSVSVELIESFVRVLENLVDKGDETTRDLTEAMFAYPPELEPVQTEGFEDQPYTRLSTQQSRPPTERQLAPAGPVLSSVEAERKLLDAFHRVRHHSQAQAFLHHTLGQYWQENWVRAPFVEALTFKQLAEMNLSNLLDKRTFSQSKIQGILECIDEVCQRHESVDPGAAEEDTRSAEPIGLPERRPARQYGWTRLDSDAPVLIRALAALLDVEHRQLPLPGNCLKAFFSGLSSTDAGMLLAESIYGIEGLADTTEQDEKKCAARISTAQRKLKKALSQYASEEVGRMSRLLQSPAVSPSVLFDGPQDAYGSGTLAGMAATAVLQTLGAHPAVIEDMEWDDCWTSNQKGLEILWKTLASQEIKSRKAFLALAASLVPLVSEQSLEWLWEHTSLREQNRKKSGRK